MADLITYADKVSIDPKPNPVNQLWRYLDANEVKAVVNNHAGLIETNEDDVAFINQNIISNIVVQNSDLTINNGDEGNFYVCNNGASTITVTINQDATGSIPINTSIYFIRNSAGRLVIDGTNVTVFANDNGTTGNYEVELEFGMICLTKIAANQYIIAGNLLLG